MTTLQNSSLPSLFCSLDVIELLNHFSDFMTIEEKAGKTLAEVGVTDAHSVHSLFQEVQKAASRELKPAVGRQFNGLRQGSASPDGAA